MTTKIGVVDAHPVFRLGIRHLLSDILDLTLVAEAGTLADALALLEREEFHVILLGTNLPNSESIELARWLYEEKRSQRVIVLSAFEEDRSLMFEMLAWRVAGYLTKTEPAENIVTAIRRSIHDGIGWIGPQIKRAFQDNKVIPEEIAQKLTTQEKKILMLLARGAGNRKVADELFMAEKTVKNHITNLFRKLSVTKRSEAIAWAWQHGMIDRDLGQDS